MYIKRHIERIVQEISENTSALLITGARQVGKSTVLQQMFPRYVYETLDDVNTIQAISTDTVGYLRINGYPMVLDEIQKAPTLFNGIKYMIDTVKKEGMYYLTGSQKFELMKGVSESLSGRISVIELYGLSVREINGDVCDIPFLPTEEFLLNRAPRETDIRTVWEIIHKGGMPALYSHPKKDWEKYYADYVNTYIERDIHQLSQVGDTLTFMQFLTALASRTGELLNMESIAKDVGITAPTVKKWISVLQASNMITLLQPFSLNAVKRVVKTPKVYFNDTGLVCYLCKWTTADTLMNGAQAGSVFETFVVGEIIKSYCNAGKEPNLYFYRTADGQEVDVLFYRDGTLYPVEIKKTSSPNIKDIKHFQSLSACFPTLKIGEGGVVCTAEKILPLGVGNKIIPLRYL